MSINDSLLNNLNFNELGLCKFEVECFLKSAPRDRKKVAIVLAEKILNSNGKSFLGNYLTHLLEVEKDTADIIKKGRDHVSHALLCFLLMTYIEQNIHVRSIRRVDRLQFKLAGLLHDIGYSLELTNKVIKKYISNIEGIWFKFEIGNLKNLSDDRKSLEYLQRRITEWSLGLDVNDIWKHEMQSENKCHGIIGSLILLKDLDKLYSKHNPKREHQYIVVEGHDFNQDNFDDDIVSACTAVFLHNLGSENYFKGKSKINYKKAPIAFLLKLADELQTWDRPCNYIPEESEYFLAKNFDISFENNEKIKVSMQNGEVVLEKIRIELENVLDVTCKYDETNSLIVTIK